jgi:hypothetical protein
VAHAQYSASQHPGSWKLAAALTGDGDDKLNEEVTKSNKGGFSCKDFNFVIAKISDTTEITEFHEIRPKFR